jgi:hypothetical protein
MANFMVRNCGCDGHYADVEFADAELERYLVLSCNIGLEHEDRAVCRHHEAREALVLSVAGVTTVMLIEGLILLILY